MGNFGGSLGLAFVDDQWIIIGDFLDCFARNRAKWLSLAGHWPIHVVVVHVHDIFLDVNNRVDDFAHPIGRLGKNPMRFFDFLLAKLQCIC